MFTQTDTLHLLFNALWLFCFGRLIGSIISYRNVIAVYLIGGICGGLIFVLLYETIARADGWLMGASASVIALAMSVAVVMPKRKIPLVLFGNVRVIWIISIVVLLIILGTSIDNLGGAIAHFGGLVSGLALGILIKRRYLCVTTIDTVNSELDILLNKVKQNGYSSLSSREQKRLFELSAKHNKK
jgi:membrane associated rhomboid family serine protease